MQVSFCKEAKAWVVCSKNVAMLVRTKADIEKYKQTAMEGRFTYACLMSTVWFEILDKLTPELRAQIESDLNGRTMVGEYIGSQDHQHLVKYSRVTIIFYAVIDNYSEESCWPC